MPGLFRRPPQPQYRRLQNRDRVFDRSPILLAPGDDVGAKFLQARNEGREISAAAGTYLLPGGWDSGAGIDGFTQPLTIIGAGMDVTIFDGQGVLENFLYMAADFYGQGFTLTGFVPNDNAMIAVLDGCDSATLGFVKMVGNGVLDTTAHGFYPHVATCEVTVANCVFESIPGAAIQAYYGGVDDTGLTLDVSGCTFQSQHANLIAAVGAWTVDSCTFELPAQYHLDVQAFASMTLIASCRTANGSLGNITGGGTVTGSLPLCSYEDLVTHFDPTGYWRFGEPSGTTATAVVGPNLTYVNTPTLGATGLIEDADTAATFARASSQYAFVASTTIVSGPNGVSAAAWVDFGSMSAGEVHTILSWADQDTSIGYHLLYYDVDAGAIRWQYADGSVAFESYTWAADALPHFWAVTHDYTNELVKFYLDGALVATAPTSGTEIAVVTGKPLRWGGYVGGGSHINGTIDEPALFDSILSGVQIANLYTVGLTDHAYTDAVTALSPFGYWRLGEASGTVAVAEVGADFAYSNTPTLGVTGLLAGDADTAVTFSRASSEYVGSAGDPGDPDNNAITVTAWVKFGSMGAGEIHSIFGWGDQSGTVGFHWLYYQVDSTRLGWQYAGGGASEEFIPYSWVPGSGTHFVVVVQDYVADSVKFYIDGTLVQTTSPAPGTGIPVAGATAMRWGANATGGVTLNGTLDEVALFDSALTGPQIANLYAIGAASAGTSVSAELASGTGSALAASIRISANALIVAGTGSALAVSAKVSPNAAAATGTGAAGDVDELTSVTGVGAATGTGSALNVIPLIKPNAGLSSGTGSAHSPPVKIDPRPSAATGTGAANNASIHIKPNAGIAAGTGTANNVIPGYSGLAQVASGTGTAGNASVHVQPSAELSSGTGVAAGASAKISVYAERAAGIAGYSYAGAVMALAPVGYWRLGERSGTTAVDEVGTNNGVYEDVGGGDGPTLASTGLLPNGDANPAITFVDAGDQVRLPNHASLNQTTALSVVAWVKRTGSLTLDHRVFSKGASDNQYELLMAAVGPKWQIRYELAGGRQYINGVDNVGTTADTVYMVAFSYDSSTGPKLYVDGVEQGATGPTGALVTTTDVAAIGNKANGNSTGDSWPGVVDEVAIFDKVLTPAEIAALYAIGVSGSAFDATASTEVTDVSANAEVATGTGAAGSANANIQPNAGLTSGTGAALQPSETIAPRADVAAGTGSAGTASNHIKPNAGAATGTGAANNATVLTAEYRYAAAELASGTGAAGNASASIKPSAGLSSGTGAASQPLASIAPRAELASGTGSAFNATGVPNELTLAEVATGTGAANNASISIAPNAGLVSGTGTADLVSAHVQPNAELASGTGAALDATATAVEPQILRPIADLSGNWHGEDARTTTLYTSVDDNPFEDATYVESPTDPTSSDFHEFDLPTATDPLSSDDHIVRYRYGGEGTATLVVELRQGATVIASWSHVDPTTPALAEQTLTSGEADAITDYSDLRIRVRAV